MVDESDERDGPLAGQSAVLQAIATRAPLAETLTTIVELVSRQVPGSRPSIMMLDRDTNRLHVMVPGRVPSEFAAACDGLPVGPASGSCGTAVHRCAPVIAADIETDPLWVHFRALALAHGLRACWSFPILSRSRDGEPTRALGSFAVYREAPGAPTELAREVIARAEYLASIAIESDRTLRELRESEARFRTFVDHATDAFFVHADDGSVVDVNQQACISLGYTRDELIGMKPPAFDPDINDAGVAALGDALDRGETLTFETRHRRKDGSTFPVEIRARAFGSAAARQRIALVRDISERRRTESALRETTDALRRAQELADVGNFSYVVADGVMDGSVVAWRILGFAPGAHPFATYLERVHAEDRARVELAWRAVLAGGVFDVEHRVDVGGSTRWVHVRGTARRDSGDEPTRVDGVVQDVTARRRLEDQLRQAQKMEAVGQLAGGVAHDFNNLLTVINGFSDVLLDQLAAGDPAREDLAAIREAGARAEMLTSQLLAFSRRSIIERRTVHLNEIIARLTRILRRLIGENISVTTTLDRHLHPIEADPGQIEQVLMNLVVNARDAMPGGGRLEVRTRNVQLPDGDDPELPAGDYVELAIVDSGDGMTDDVKSRVFEPFFTTKGPGRGTGLGLSTVYGIAKQGGGHVRVESQVGQGSTFSVLFPVSERVVADAPPSSKAIAPGTETILLVEDEDGVRRLAARALERHGYVVLDAPDGATALELAHANPSRIDALVTDVVMPGLSGRDLAIAIKRTRPEIRVVYMSGYTDDAVLRHGVSLSLDAFLQKPFSPAALVAKVRAVLDEAREPTPS